VARDAGRFVLVAALEGLVGWAATVSIQGLVADSLARDIGVIAVWVLVIILAGGWLIVHTWRSPSKTSAPRTSPPTPPSVVSPDAVARIDALRSELREIRRVTAEARFPLPPALDESDNHPASKVAATPAPQTPRSTPSLGPDIGLELSILSDLVLIINYRVNIAGLDNPAASFDIEFRVFSACLFPIRFKECTGTAQIFTRQASEPPDRLGAISKRIEFMESNGPVGDPLTIYRGWPKWFTIRVWLDADGRDELRKADQAKLASRSINPTFVVVGHEDCELALMPSEPMMGLPIKGPLGPIVMWEGPA
jgi:hypothetical protein